MLMASVSFGVSGALRQVFCGEPQCWRYACPIESVGPGKGEDSTII